MIAERSNSGIRLAVMAGDGIRPKVAAATLAVLAAADRAFGFDLAFEQVPVGAAALRVGMAARRPTTPLRAPWADRSIMGAVGQHDYPPGRSMPVDLVIVRENTDRLRRHAARLARQAARRSAPGEAAGCIEAALDTVIANPQGRAPDLGARSAPRHLATG